MSFSYSIMKTKIKNTYIIQSRNIYYYLKKIQKMALYEGRPMDGTKDARLKTLTVNILK